MRPAELMAEPERTFKPGMGRGEREAQMRSDIFVAEMGQMAIVAAAISDGSWSIK